MFTVVFRLERICVKKNDKYIFILRWTVPLRHPNDSNRPPHRRIFDEVFSTKPTLRGLPHLSLLPPAEVPTSGEQTAPPSVLDTYLYKTQTLAWSIWMTLKLFLNSYFRLTNKQTNKNSELSLGSFSSLKKVV